MLTRANPGVGKSVLLRAIICHFHSCLHPDAVAVTATTGIAAQNIGGRTIHSFAGCGYGREDTEELGYKVRNNRVARDRWRRVEVLIMDEGMSQDCTEVAESDDDHQSVCLVAIYLIN